MWYRKTRLLSVSLLAVFACACSAGPRTSVSSVKKASNLENVPYQNVLVMAVAADKRAGSQFENSLVSRLRSATTRARTYHKNSTADQLSADALRSLAVGMGVDAILLTSVKTLDENVKIDEGRTETDSRPIGGSFVDYFRYEYEDYTVVPNLDVSFTVFLVTDVYDASSGKRVYSLTTRTKDATSNWDVILDEAVIIGSRLRRDGIVR